MISHFDLSVISPNGPTFPVQHPTKHGELKASLKHDYDSNVRFLKIGVAYVAQKYFKVLVERCSAVGMGWDSLASTHEYSLYGLRLSREISLAPPICS